MTEDGRNMVSHYMPCSGECESAKQAIQKLKQQDELFLMLYDENMDSKRTSRKHVVASAVTTLEGELKQLRRIVGGCKLADSAAESTMLVTEKTTVTEVCAEQLIADTVAAGVTVAEETHEEGVTWCDNPDTGHTWVRSDLSKNVQSVGQPRGLEDAVQGL